MTIGNTGRQMDAAWKKAISAGKKAAGKGVDLAMKHPKTAIGVAIVGGLAKGAAIGSMAGQTPVKKIKRKLGL